MASCRVYPSPTVNEKALKEAGITQDHLSSLDLAHVKPISPTIWRAGKRVAWNLSRATSSYTRQKPAWVEQCEVFGDAPIMLAEAKLEKQSAGVDADKKNRGGQAGEQEKDVSNNLEHIKVRTAWAAAKSLDAASSQLDKTVIDVSDLPIAWGRTVSSYARTKPAWEEGIIDSTIFKPTTSDHTNTDIDPQEMSIVLDKEQIVQGLDEEIRVAEKTWKEAKEFALSIEEKIERRQLKVFVCI